MGYARGLEKERMKKNISSKDSEYSVFFKIFHLFFFLNVFYSILKRSFISLYTYGLSYSRLGCTCRNQHRKFIHHGPLPTHVNGEGTIYYTPRGAESEGWGGEGEGSGGGDGMGGRDRLWGTGKVVGEGKR